MKAEQTKKTPSADNLTIKRLLQIFSALKLHSVTGLTLTEIADLLNFSPATALRYLNTAVDAGYLTRLIDGNYALGNEFLRVAYAHRQAIDRERQKLDECEQRIAAGSMA